MVDRPDWDAIAASADSSPPALLYPEYPRLT